MITVSNIFVSPSYDKKLCSVQCYWCDKSETNLVFENYIDENYLDKVFRFIKKSITYNTISLSMFWDFFLNFNAIKEVLNRYDLDWKILFSWDIKNFLTISDKSEIIKFFLSHNNIIMYFSVNYKWDKRHLELQLKTILEFVKIFNKRELEIGIQISNISLKTNTEYDIVRLYQELYSRYWIEILIETWILLRDKLNNLSLNWENTECLFRKIDIQSSQYDMSILDITERKISFHIPYCQNIIYNDFGSIYDSEELILKRYSIFKEKISNFINKEYSGKKNICKECIHFFK